MSASQGVRFTMHNLRPDRDDTIAVLTIARPETANAFNRDVVFGISQALSNLKSAINCRCLVVRGEGKHFSAGADLQWMQASARLDRAGNQDEAQDLARMFEALAFLPIPTIALAQGAVYGGAVGLVAACDITIATVDARFCLSETSLGLLPAVILPHLLRRMPLAVVKRFSLNAQVFSSEDAQRLGLVDHCVPNMADLNAVLRTELEGLLRSGPLAQQRFKQLFHHLTLPLFADVTTQAIADVRAGDEAKHGLAQFFAKKEPAWRFQLPEDWNLDAF